MASTSGETLRLSPRTPGAGGVETPRMGHCQTKLELMNERTYIQLNMMENYLKTIIKINHDNAMIIGKTLDNMRFRLDHLQSTMNCLYLGFKNNPMATEDITESDEECAGHVFTRPIDLKDKV